VCHAEIPDSITKNQRYGRRSHSLSTIISKFSSKASLRQVIMHFGPVLHLTFQIASHWRSTLSQARMRRRNLMMRYAIALGLNFAAHSLAGNTRQTHWPQTFCNRDDSIYLNQQFKAPEYSQSISESIAQRSLGYPCHVFCCGCN
jgi:hypothetical protein